MRFIVGDFELKEPAVDMMARGDVVWISDRNVSLFGLRLIYGCIWIIVRRV